VAVGSTNRAGASPHLLGQQGFFLLLLALLVETEALLKVGRHRRAALQDAPAGGAQRRRKGARVCRLLL
jgi:hypothetical protein